MAPAEQLDRHPFTYQTRLLLSAYQANCLQETASLLSIVEHKLFAAAALKSDFIKEYAIRVRHFNTVCISLEGKIKAIRALTLEHLKTLED